MKRTVSFFVIITLIFSMFALVGCNNKKLDPEIDRQIREAYSSTDPDNVKYWYCGTYRGNVAIYPLGVAGQAITVVEVAGIEYTYSDTNQILIFSDGELYTMPEAYEKGLIGYFDVRIIFYKFSKLYTEWREGLIK